MNPIEHQQRHRSVIKNPTGYFNRQIAGAPGQEMVLIAVGVTILDAEKGHQAINSAMVTKQPAGLGATTCATAAVGSEEIKWNLSANNAVFIWSMKYSLKAFDLLGLLLIEENCCTLAVEYSHP